MRTLAIATVALSFVGAAAIGTTVPVQAQGFYFDAPGVHVGVGRYHRHYMIITAVAAHGMMSAGLDHPGRCL